MKDNLLSLAPFSLVLIIISNDFKDISKGLTLTNVILQKELALDSSTLETFWNKTKWHTNLPIHPTPIHFSSGKKRDSVVQTIHLSETAPKPSPVILTVNSLIHSCSS
jgi:hypothetical protein